MRGYVGRLLFVLDILVNVLRGGRGETVSSACGKQIVAGNPCKACSLLCGLLNRAFKGRWKDHCINNRMDPIK
ncbi:MAG: hypothetical protein JWQ03_3166 [Variovorax sp.]|jgi:hypothetical protein|nr:hypothetical protein [Variovorax sp.]